MNEPQVAAFWDDPSATSREAMVAGANLTSVIVRAGLVEEDRLAARREETQDVVIRQTAIGQVRIEPNNPFLAEKETGHLDERGIVRIGTIVKPWMISVSLIRPVRPTHPKNRRRLRPAEAGKEWARDASHQFLKDVAGFVVSNVRYEHYRDRPADFEPGAIERVRIHLERRDPIGIGEIILVNGIQVFVSEVRDDAEMPKGEDGRPIDMLVPMDCLPDAYGTRPVSELADVSRLLGSASDAVSAFTAGGPYSLITQRPLRGFSGAVTVSQISWLRANGFSQIATDFVSLKSEDLVNREKLIECADEKRELPLDVEPACPLSVDILCQHFRILGLDPKVCSGDESIEFELNSANDELTLEFGPTELRKPETINYRTYLPEPGGLFCEEAFGLETHSRRLTGAHVKLGSPIVPIIYRLGSRPILASILDIEPNVIEDILEMKTGLNVSNGKPEFGSKEDSETYEFEGAEAIEWLLQNRDGVDSSNYVLSTLYVCPPDLRPLVLLDSGNFATSDLNDLYRRIINRNNRLRKLKELDAPGVIVDNEIRMLHQQVDQLHANTIVDKPILGSGSRPLRDALSMCVESFEASSQRDANKHVDWSGSARLGVNDRLATNEVELPTEIYQKLLCDESTVLLLAGEEAFVGCKPIALDLPIQRVHSRVLEFLGLKQGDECALHRPISAKAVAQAQQLMDRGLAEGYASAKAISEPRFEETLEEILRCVREGERLSFASDRRFMVGGGGSTERPTEELPVNKRGSEPMQIPLPLPPEPPTLEEMSAVLQLETKNTCELILEKASFDPPPKDGRVGGVPWLPRGTKWPFDGQRPLTFLSQVPLDEAVAAKSLPFDVPLGSMLTMFWNEEWYELGKSSSPAIFIHGTDDLAPLEPPDDVEVGVLCKFRIDRRREVPSWREMEDRFRMQFGDLPQELLKDFQAKYFFEDQAPRERSRLGGYGFWIQSSYEDFVFQLTSEGEAELCFGDAGSIYVLGKAPHNLTAVMDCY